MENSLPCFMFQDFQLLSYTIKIKSFYSVMSDTQARSACLQKCAGQVYEPNPPSISSSTSSTGTSL